MAYYRKRNGIWSYTVELPRGPNGERRQAYKGGFKKEKDAIAEAIAIENEILNGGYIPDSELTMKDLAELWLKHYSQVVRKSTYVRRTYDVIAINRYIGDRKVQKITKRDYQELLYKINEERGFIYARQLHGALCMMFKYAAFLDIIKFSPTAGCQLPKAKEEEESVQYLEKNELIKFLEEAKAYPLFYELFRFLAYSGCRVGEALALTWPDVETNDIALTKTLFYLYEGGKTLYTNPPKTKSGIRTIFIDNDTLNIVRKLKTLQLEFKMKNRDYATQYVFARDDGLPPTGGIVNERFKEILRKTGIDKKLTTHSLRHTHVSILAAAGVPLEEIQKRLGHSKDNITREIYYHVTKERKTAAADAFTNYMKIQ